METQLFLVPTPIGNMEDITLRALRVLKEVDFVLAEDTRQTGKLFKHHEIENSLRPFHSFNEHKVLDKVIDELQTGKTAAVVSDAGMPGISDPGFLLARACKENNIKFETLPGASAVLPALINSGFPCDRFVFEGFLPHKKGRKKRIAQIAEEERTTVLYESPHRILKLLKELAEFTGDERRISVSRELTKLYEENISGTAAELIAHFEQSKPKGEFAVVVEPKK